MLEGLFDPFRNVSDEIPGQPDMLPGLHFGVVKSFNAATYSCMVLVPSVNDREPLGPMRIVIPIARIQPTTSSLAPMTLPKNTQVLVAFLDGKFERGVVLGRLSF